LQSHLEDAAMRITLKRLILSSCQHSISNQVFHFMLYGLQPFEFQKMEIRWAAAHDFNTESLILKSSAVMDFPMVKFQLMKIHQSQPCRA